MTMRVTRRTFLTTTAAGLAVAGFPLPLRAQASTFRIGAVHPVTGPLAEPGQACPGSGPRWPWTPSTRPAASRARAG